MNVGELKTRLEKYDNDTLIILSSDEEGNSYREGGLRGQTWVREDGYEYELVYEEDFNEDKEGMTFDEYLDEIDAKLGIVFS